MNAFFQGLALGFSLILCIGAQNAFVLRQGLRNQHLLAICLTCAASDAILIMAGVSGFQTVIEQLPALVPIMRWVGGAFLVVYGARCFLSAYKGTQGLDPANLPETTCMTAVLSCLAITWLNPHVYLDTVFLIGSVSTGFPGKEQYFAAGAMMASFVFFFILGYGAILLRPVFHKPKSWQILDVGIGITMWIIAYHLVA